jgi:hypothetical protein
LRDTGQRNVLADQRNTLDFSLFVKIEHKLGFDLCESIQILLEGHIEIVLLIIIPVIIQMLPTLLIVLILFAIMLFIVIPVLFLLIAKIELKIIVI